jgi:hypothetical protein
MVRPGQLKAQQQKDDTAAPGEGEDADGSNNGTLLTMSAERWILIGPAALGQAYGPVPTSYSRGSGVPMSSATGSRRPVLGKVAAGHRAQGPWAEPPPRVAARPPIGRMCGAADLAAYRPSRKTDVHRAWRAVRHPRRPRWAR